MFEIVKLICVALSAFIIINCARRECSFALAFVLFALWLRFALSAFHELTHPSIFMGLSINALASIAVVFIGLMYLPFQAFLFKKLTAFYIFAGAILLSGFINTASIDLINVMIKWCYLLVISLALVLAIRAQQLNHCLLMLMKAFYLPLSLMVLSIVFGEVKATESDGSVSYVGGYRHEAGFSMLLLSFVLIVSLVDKTALPRRSIIFYVSVALLILVNYRTAMLALVPIVFFFILANTQQKIAAKFRVVTLVSIALGVSVGLYLLSFSMSGRFQDINTVLLNWDELVKAPDYFSQTERRLFSSRVYLWSQYLHEFVNASFLHQSFGHGPEAWKNVFSLYAHNTYISYLYEYGVFGLTSFSIFIISIFHNMLRIKDETLKMKLVGALLGFLIMNLATMPLWNIEGLILFSIIVSVALAPKREFETQSVPIMNQSFRRHI